MSIEIDVFESIKFELRIFLQGLDDETRRIVANSLIETIRAESANTPDYFTHFVSTAQAEVERRQSLSKRPLEKIPRMLTVFIEGNGNWLPKQAFIDAGIVNLDSLNTNFDNFRDFLEEIGYKLISEKQTNYKIVPIDSIER